MYLISTLSCGGGKRRLRDFFIRNRNAESRAKRFDFFVVQFLLLVRDVLAFADSPTP